MSSTDYNQWSTVRSLFGSTLKSQNSWIPPEDQDRINAYIKYDQMYWNDPNQYALRVLEGEQPLYIPNARTVVDTTAYYLLKGFELSCDGNETTQKYLDNFLKREAFYSRFNLSKAAGVTRGDFVFHMTANPKKAPGTRISLTSVDPSTVFPTYDEHEPGKLTGCHIAVQYEVPDEPDKSFVRRLTYKIVEVDGTKRISRSEAIYELDTGWFSSKAKLKKTILPEGLLDARITTIPIYWYKNKGWDGEDFGSSELRGLESILQTISQGSTDVSASLAIEGLGVYATDGGRPVDNNGVETDWEVSPGKVMEVPQGSYFRRVEGVGSITPATDQIKYLESKLHEATGLSDVALGTVEAQIAQSGIALAIRFSPTLAKMETREQLSIDTLTQMFYDWKTWVAVFEQQTMDGDIIPVTGDKLPTDRVARVNELNNMIDRKIIPMSYYRQEMEKLGYVFPDDIQDQLDKEREKAIQDAREAMLATRDQTQDSNSDETSTDGDTLPSAGNKSNNRNRPNESSGTEAKPNARDAQK